MQKEIRFSYSKFGPRENTKSKNVSDQSKDAKRADENPIKIVSIIVFFIFQYYGIPFSYLKTRMLSGEDVSFTKL